MYHHPERTSPRRSRVPEHQSLGVSRPGFANSVREASKKCRPLGQRRGPVLLRKVFGVQLANGGERRQLCVGDMLARLLSLRAESCSARCFVVVSRLWDGLVVLRGQVLGRTLKEPFESASDR